MTFTEAKQRTDRINFRIEEIDLRLDYLRYVVKAFDLAVRRCKWRNDHNEDVDRECVECDGDMYYFHPNENEYSWHDLSEFIREEIDVLNERKDRLKSKLAAVYAAVESSHQ